MKSQLLISVVLLSLIPTLVSGVLSDVCHEHADCADIVDGYCLKYGGCYNGSCACLPGYVSINNTVCRQAQKVGGQCSDNAECPTHASCSSGQCQCGTGYIESGGSCVGRIDIGDSLCDTVNYLCRGGSTCVSGNCLCPTGMKANNGVCVYYGLGEHCGSLATCNAGLGLICVNNVCACNTNWGYRTVYNGASEQQRCVHDQAERGVRAFFPCTPSDFSMSARLCDRGLTCMVCPQDTDTCTLCRSGTEGLRMGICGLQVVPLLVAALYLGSQ